VRRTILYASAQSLDLLELVKNFSFLDWKLFRVLIMFPDGKYLGDKDDTISSKN